MMCVRQLNISFILVSFLNNSIKLEFSLIPKTQSPQKPEDSRPSALDNTIYKIISKIIALRMKKHIINIIGRMQAAYVPGGLISENVCLFQEIVQAMKYKEGRCGHLSPKWTCQKNLTG